MNIRPPALVRLGVPLVAGALLMAACSSSGGASSGGGGTTSAPAPPAASAPPAAAAATAVTVTTAKNSTGTFLADSSGRALYLWDADPKGRSSCAGACLQYWPALTTKGAPKASGAAIAKDLGTTKRSDGSTQVTYAGHPLYYYAGDTAPGQTNGQGSSDFGATWWLVAPSGQALAGKTAAKNSAPAGGGYGGY